MKKNILTILLFLSFLFSPFTICAQENWKTKAEETDFTQTSRYNETILYCKKLEQASQAVKFTSFGKSPEGRELPLLILSRDQAFTPQAAKATGKAIVLIQSGIHSGEIDGKEASLMLAREIVISRSLEKLLDSVIVLMVPIYNVDGHEQFNAYNRINQDGPKEMGARATAQNLNLNRDYLKADAPETRAFLSLFNNWLPDMFIDVHVTDGADFQYDLLYTIEEDGYVAPEISKYVREVFQPHVKPAVEKAGHITEQYISLRDSIDPSKGFDVEPFTPRFSNGFGALRNRPTILIETHMLKPFKIRVKATYDLLVETLREIDRDPESLKAAVRSADLASIKLGESYINDRKVPLLFSLTDKAKKMKYRGKEFKIEMSEISGTLRVIYNDKPIEIEVPLYNEIKEEASVVPPLAYIVPPSWIAVIERLQSHGLKLERLAEPITSEFETYILKEPKWNSTPYEGRQTVRYKSSLVKQQRTLPIGSVVVRLDQPNSKIAIHLLEPSAPDSLLFWGLFNSIFEQKEYGESYVLEKMAREMLEKDPELKKEFMEKLRSDSSFRGNPDARLNFFYDRSPYRDKIKNVYPVVRVTEKVALKTVPF